MESISNKAEAIGKKMTLKQIEQKQHIDETQSQKAETDTEMQ